MSNITDITDAKRARFEAGLSKKERVSLLAEIKSIHPGMSFMGLPPGDWGPQADEFGLPPHCPVRPLGREGETFYVLNTYGSPVALTPNGAKKANMQALFAGCSNYLIWAWPRKVAKGKDIDNFDADRVVKALFDACHEKSMRHGTWTPVDKVRGRGVWRQSNGNLVVHCGDYLLIEEGNEWRNVEPEEFDGYLYPKAERLDGPSEARLPGGTDGPGIEALQIFRSWNWGRPDLDPELLLGWLGVAFMGGALAWRPAVYVTGDKGVGKSTLLSVIDAMLGRMAQKPTDATAAGLYRAVKYDCVPVILDEFEGKDDNRKAQAVLDLARQSSSGGLVLRAGPDGGGVQFMARSPFLFSSINPPGLEPQDMSRLAFLELRPLERKASADFADQVRLAALGQEIFRRLIEDHERVDELINLFRAKLIEVGHSGRGGDTFGILAAISHGILYDDAPDDALLDEWARKLDPKDLVEMETAVEGWSDCFDQLLSAQPDVYRNASAKSVGGWISWFCDKDFAQENIDGMGYGEAGALKQLNKALELVGLRLVMPRSVQLHGDSPWDVAELFVPSMHPATAKLFTGTKWSGRGVWASSLRQAPKDAWRTCSQRVGIQHFKGVALKLSRVLSQENEE